MEKERRDPKEKKCAACGKDMYAGEDWAYKRRKTGQRTKWFCSYKCMRAWDAKHDGKNAAVVTVDEEHAAPKEPVSRAVLARALAKEIKNGGSVIAYMTAEGYKNPYEAYNSVRHYCETKAPELAEVLKPLKDLPKAPAAKTGRPRKYPAKVETVDKVPEIEHECGNCKHKGKTSHEPPCDTCPDPISCRMRAWEPEEDLQPVQCIAHVTAMDIEEVHEAADANRASFEPMPLILRGGVDYQLKIDEAMQAEVQQKKPGFRYEIKTIETEIGDFSYDRKAHLLIFRKKDEKDDLGWQYMSMSTAEWDKLLTIVPQLADLMGVTL